MEAGFGESGGSDFSLGEPAQNPRKHGNSSAALLRCLQVRRRSEHAALFIHHYILPSDSENLAGIRVRRKRLACSDAPGNHSLFGDLDDGPRQHRLWNGRHQSHCCLFFWRRGAESSLFSLAHHQIGCHGNCRRRPYYSGPGTRLYLVYHQPSRASLAQKILRMGVCVPHRSRLRVLFLVWGSCRRQGGRGPRCLLRSPWEPH